MASAVMEFSQFPSHALLLCSDANTVILLPGEEYRPDLDQWTVHSDMPVAMADAAGAVLGSEMVLFGGVVDNGSTPGFLDRAQAATRRISGGTVVLRRPVYCVREHCDSDRSPTLCLMGPRHHAGPPMVLPRYAAAAVLAGQGR